VKSQEHYVTIRVRGLTYELVVNGVKVGNTREIPAISKGANGKRGVYAFPGWKTYSSLKGTLKDVEFCNYLPTDNACRQKSGSVAISKGNELFSVKIGANYDVIFFVTLSSSAGSGPILYIGNNGIDEQPNFYWLTNGDLRLYFDDHNNHDQTFKAGMVKGREHSVLLEVRGLNYKLFVNGNSKGQGTMPSQSKGSAKTRKVSGYPSFLHYSTSVAGTLRDVTVCPERDPVYNPSVNQCSPKSAVHEFEKGYKVYEIVTGSSYDLLFTATVYHGSGQGSIIWVGNNEDDEQPEVLWYTDGNARIEFQADKWTGFRYTSNLIQAGRSNAVKIEVRNNEYKLFVNGAYKGKKTFSHDNKGLSGKRAIWAYPPWRNYPNLKGYIRDVQVCNK